VEHIWNPDKGYSSIVTAVAAGLPYHTVQKPHIPRIYGPQTAIVTDNIDPDAGGDCRVQVKFNWPDNGGEDPLSAYVRVAQPWAGLEHGTVFFPHPDDEVVVEFMNGDPNFPLITGSVYNGVNNEYYTPEVTTEPTATIRSTGNELRLIDTAGEETAILSSKTRIVNTLNDPEADIDDTTACVDIGPEKLLINHPEKPIEVTAGADAMTLTASKAVGITSETDAITIEASTSITLKVGGNEIVIDASGVTITGNPAVNIN
jgi:type VI secretion system secreted protein VgrG